MLSMTEEEYYTPEQVAQKLQLKPGSITKLLRGGQLPGYKIHGVWRINKAELEEYLRRQRNVKDKK